ncbi:MAG: hypothetical protein ACFKPT_29725 [Gloeotrichia echinulata GP01]
MGIGDWGLGTGAQGLAPLQGYQWRIVGLSADRREKSAFLALLHNL